MQFLVLHDYNDRLVYLNANTITSIIRNSDGGSVVWCSGMQYEFAETPDQIIGLLTEGSE